MKYGRTVDRLWSLLEPGRPVSVHEFLDQVEDNVEVRHTFEALVPGCRLLVIVDK
jgi:hypothetical protein